jgi:SAM-dependent methyltransferase
MSSNLIKKSLRRFKNRFSDQMLKLRSPVNIWLNKLLVGQQYGTPSQEWFRQTHDKTRFSQLLCDSPYVSFLREAIARPSLLDDDAALQKISYYEMANLCRVYTGEYFRATKPEQICQWMRQYYQIFTAFNRDSQTMPLRNGHSRKKSYPVVNKICDSDLYEVEDGHHRLAVMLVKGWDRAQVIVRGKKRTYLQEELFRVNQTDGTELYQPVPLPEVQTWSLIRKCEDRLAMILQFLKQRQLLSENNSVLDCACSYGWFVRQFKDRGFRVLGLDRDKTAIELGQLIYNIEETDFKLEYLEKFISKNEDTFDIVLCLSILHHYVIGKEKGVPENIVQGLSKITNKVLFIDTGQSHERWFHRVLSQWDTDFIRRFLLENGNFTEVIPLGSDTDNVGKFENNYGRTLFACVK